MSQTRRILIGLAVLIVIGGVVLGLEYFRGLSLLQPEATGTPLPAGSIPIYVDGELAAGFAPNALEVLELVNFVDAEEEKPQDGWLLRDVLLAYLPEGVFTPDTKITVTSSSRNKTAELSWAEVENRENMVMFDLSNRGTLKLVSLLEKLDMRDEWIQDVDRIDVTTK